MTSTIELDELADALRRGEVVGVPTDTVYGLAVDARLTEAVTRVFELKRRPASVALPVLVGSPEQGAELTLPAARGTLAVLASRFWPGALTIVVERAEGAGLHVGGDPTTVGLRCPAQPLVRELCGLVGPLATTSANRHGEPPCTTADEVRALFGDEVPVLDGGPCAGEPSTVVALTGTGPMLLRAGPVSLAAIEDVIAVPQRRARGL